ncbi:chromate efflux transporter [Mesorhizobium sp. M0006]|uniref:chromate efflux transporter n=1 Tax=Mesorhizobium sp. M0006 TaxID=2956838 RepID=UPI00333943F9
MANPEQSVATQPSLAEIHDHGISFADAMRVWARVAMLSFGGPAGQIAMMHRIIVEEKRWIGETRFLHALNYCTLLPGPEAQQLAIYIGWLMHKTKGGLVAGILFVLPGAIAIMVLSWIYAIFGNVGAVQALFFGLKAAVLAIVLEAVLRIGRRALRNNVMVGLAAAAFIALFFFHAPFPLVILVAAAIGYVGGKMGWAAFQPGNGHGKLGGRQVDDADSALGEGMPAHARPSARWWFEVAGVGLLLWLVPVLGLLAFLGQGNVFTDIAIFFSKMAVVTFGGAYAVLAYVAQQGVEHYGWLKPGEMLDGLGMAETTPGPLIMVTQFVGFMGAYRAPGVLNSLVAGTLGGLLTTWVTFVPCFLWIFLGAPYIESMRSNKALSAALSTITAAVVGVILNLAVWFALHVLFRDLHQVDLLGMRLDVPALGSINIPSLLLTLGAMLAVFRFKVGVIPVLAACSILGVLYGVAAGSI